MNTCWMLPPRRKIAVFYHCILSGGSVPISTNHAFRIMSEQMRALRLSGLEEAADEIHIGLNGDTSDLKRAKMVAPEKASFYMHGARATTEIPTLNALKKWTMFHPDWNVMYHHTKGASKPLHGGYSEWRSRMERAVVWNWPACVADLSCGIDSCGAHWLTPEQFPQIGSTPFWGGNFWWATAEFLRTLPPLPSAVWPNRFHAEMWIGSGPRRPVIADYCPGYPM